MYPTRPSNEIGVLIREKDKKLYKELKKELDKKGKKLYLISKPKSK